MSRRAWLRTILAAIPLALGGVWGYSQRLLSTGYTCPLTGEELPCPKCCPLNKECPCPECCPCEECCLSHDTNQSAMQSSAGYICPLTGEELPCAKCCPLNGASQSKPQAKAAKPEAKDTKAKAERRACCRGCCR